MCEEKQNELKLQVLTQEYAQEKDDYKSLDQKVSYLLVILVALLTCLSLVWGKEQQSVLLKTIFVIQIVVMAGSIIINLINLKVRKFEILKMDKIVKYHGNSFYECLLRSFSKIIDKNRKNIRYKGKLLKFSIYLLIGQTLMLFVYILLKFI